MGRERKKAVLGGLSVRADIPQHPDQHRSERPVLLAVDQEFGEGAIVGPPSFSAPSQTRLAIPPTAVASSTD
jgi:hypothetical protein